MGGACWQHEAPGLGAVTSGVSVELVQYLSWVGTCPEFASEPAIPAPDHAGPTRETAAEPAGTCPEFAPPLDEIRQVWTGFRRNLLEPDQVQQSPNLTENHPHWYYVRTKRRLGV